MRFRSTNLALFAFALAMPLFLGGCGASDEQNPITPDKMNEMRAKENAARQGGAAPTTPSPSGAGSR